VNIAEALVDLGRERGGQTAIVAGIKVLRRLVRGRGDPSLVSLDTLEARAVRGNPADPLLVALRCANAETLGQFICGVAVLALLKAQQGGETGKVGEFTGPCLMLAGILMENLADAAECERAILLMSRLLRAATPEAAAVAVDEYNGKEPS